VLWARVFLHRHESNAVRVKKEKKAALLVEQMHSILAYTAAEEKKDEGERKMPEASRVYELLWDKVQGCKVAKYGVDESAAVSMSTVGLLKDSISREMLKCIDLTEKARQARKGASLPETVSEAEKKDAADVADFKVIAEHDSGEKLKSQIAFVKEVAKNLGRGIIDEQQLRDANALRKRISAEQSDNNLALMKLIKPMWPNISFILAIAVINGVMRGVFHQIKYWSLLVEQAAAGDVKAASGTLLYVWAGHVVIKALELLESTFSHHAESKLGQSVRNGVLNAMVRQDFEYFYRNSPGVLQDRLNRDANELGNNIIRFPARNASRVCFIVTNVVTLGLDTPTKLLVPALVPMVVMVITMQKSFKMFNRMHQRERRVEEESIKDTSEILREIKTVRQFAMETAEAANYARAGLARHFMVEGTVVLRESLNTLLWSFFDAGLALTMFMGFPFLQSGQMTVTGMMDMWCKISFNIMCACAPPSPPPLLHQTHRWTAVPATYGLLTDN
jgi:ABC-type multidrug transport system fused ATPase/permease subunit